MTTLRIVCISDTHCQLDKIKIPAGDLILHSGDFTYSGNMKEVSNELKVFGKLSHNYKVCCVGNHDFLFEQQPTIAKQLCLDNNIIYLESDFVIIDNIKIYASSHTKWFYDWAFNLPKDGSKTEEHWNKIPNDTNILITHGPAFGILDLTPKKEHVGCEILLSKLQHDLDSLVLFQFGHIHLEGGNTRLVNNIWCANASICNEQYQPVNKPIVFDLDTETKIITQVFDIND